MAYIPRSSFIPKETAGAIPMQVRRKQTIHVFSVISIIALTVTSLAAVGSFAYTKVLNTQLNAAKASLQQKSTEDSQRAVTELRRYDEKLDVAAALLDNHLAPSRIFAALEEMTKDTVQFNTFKYTYDPGFQIALELGGVTETLSSVALQKMQVFKEGVFSNFTFQNITTNAEEQDDSSVASRATPTSIVNFTVVGTFKNDIINYTGASATTSLKSSQTEAPTATGTNATTTATTTVPNTP